jgi:hypothetical protein
VKKLQPYPARVEVLEGEIVELRNKIGKVEDEAGDNADGISELEGKMEVMERSGTDVEMKVRLHHNLFSTLKYNISLRTAMIKYTLQHNMRH